jgi:hypothetical protein
MIISARGELIQQAREIHARECPCDPKYTMSCPNMANIVLRLGGESELIFILLPGEADQPLRFECGMCHEKLNSPDLDGQFNNHTREHGKDRYHVNTIAVTKKDFLKGGTD